MSSQAEKIRCGYYTPSILYTSTKQAWQCPYRTDGNSRPLCCLVTPITCPKSKGHRGDSSSCDLKHPPFWNPNLFLGERTTPSHPFPHPKGRRQRQGASMQLQSTNHWEAPHFTVY